MTYTLTFSEPVSGLEASDLTVSNATTGSLAGSGDTWQAIDTRAPAPPKPLTGSGFDSLTDPQVEFAPGLLQYQPQYAPIRLESDNGLSNLRGTLAMARTGAPDSATSQFHFNLVAWESDADAAGDLRAMGRCGFLMTRSATEPDAIGPSEGSAAPMTNVNVVAATAV